MLAFLDGAFAVGAIAFSIGHGTDSLGGGCLGLEGQAVIPSVGAAAGCDLLILFGIGGISVAAGVAAGGFALTASPFFKRQKGTKRLCPWRTALRLGSVFPRYGVHPGASPTVCFAAPPLDVCGFAARRCAPSPRMNTFARPAEGAKDQKPKQDQKPDQEPLTLALSRGERGLTAVFGRGTPTCDTALNSGFEKPENRPPLPRERVVVRGKSTTKPTSNPLLTTQ
jgi:hypothetical protein